MQLISNSGWSEAEVLAALNSSAPSYYFPVKVLDHALNPVGWLPEGAVESARLTLDADSKPNQGVFTFTLDSSLVGSINLFNSYFQPWLKIMMRKPASENDETAWAAWKLGAYRVTDAPVAINAQKRKTYEITAHDISELLAGDQITNEYAANEGDVVTSKIKEVLESSALKTRYHVTASLETMSASKSWPAGTTILAIIDDLCAEINFVRYPDPDAFFIVTPWRDPATAPKLISYDDSGSDTIFTECRLRRDTFNQPNDVTVIGNPPESGGVPVRGHVEIFNPDVVVSQSNLLGLDGQPLIRHKVLTNVPAASQAVIDSITAREALEVTKVTESLELSSKFKPYQWIYDVIGLTRSDLSYSNTSFGIRKLDFDFGHAGRMNWLLQRAAAV